MKFISDKEGRLIKQKPSFDRSRFKRFGKLTIEVENEGFFETEYQEYGDSEDDMEIFFYKYFHPIKNNTLAGVQPQIIKEKKLTDDELLRNMPEMMMLLGIKAPVFPQTESILKPTYNWVYANRERLSLEDYVYQLERLKRENKVEID